MTISSIAGGTAASQAQGASGAGRGQEAGIAALRKIRQTEVAQATAMIELIEEAGASDQPVPSQRGRNLDVYA